MLADPVRSSVLLIHPERSVRDKASWDSCVALLMEACEIFAIKAYVVGEQAPSVATRHVGTVSILDADPLHLWSDTSAVLSAITGEAGTLFIGGTWLDEDVLVAALSAVALGYDVRLLADLSVPRLGAHRQLVYGRLALHGIPVTTLRQALLEWAVAGGDRVVIERVRGLLNQVRPGGLS